MDPEYSYWKIVQSISNFQEVIEKCTCQSIISSDEYNRLTRLNMLPETQAKLFYEILQELERDQFGEFIEVLKSSGNTRVALELELMKKIVSTDIVQLVQSALPLAKPKSSIFMPTFVGRETELEQLRETFENHSAKTIVISGPIGIGKTSLLLRFFELYPLHLKPLWLDCFNYVGNLPMPDFINKQTDEPVVLNGINCGDTLHKKILQNLLKVEKPRSIFILTRQLHSNYQFQTELHIELDPFTLEEVQELLSKSQISKDGAPDLLQISKGVPLVLNEMVRVIKKNFDGNLNKYNKSYREVLTKRKKKERDITPRGRDTIPTYAEVQRTLSQILPYFDPRYPADPNFLLHILKALYQTEKLTLDTIRSVAGNRSVKSLFWCDPDTTVKIDRDAQSELRIMLQKKLYVSKMLNKLVETCLNYTTIGPSDNSLMHLVSIWNYFCNYKIESMNVDMITKVEYTLTKGQIEFEVRPPWGHILISSPDEDPDWIDSMKSDEFLANFGDKAQLETGYESLTTSGLLKLFGNLGMTAGLPEDIASEVKDYSQINDRTNWLDSLSFTEVLGDGAFGIVLKAIDKSNGEMSAVKIIFPEYSSYPNAKTHERQSFLREAKIMINKVHPNIVATFNFAEKSLGPEDIAKIFEEMETHRWMVYKLKAQRLESLDTIFIQMEICGKTLRHWLNLNMTSAIDLGLAEFQVEIVKGLIEGMSFLHKYKIMHRDIKPENVYFSQDNMLPVKIGDFGSSRHLYQEDKDDIPYRALTFYRDDDKYSPLTSKVGTPDYRAPEANSRDYSFQADLYSLGLVIWEVVQPIRDKDRRHLFDRLVNGREESLVELHPRIANCKEIIIKLTRRKVEERTQSIQEINLIILKIKVTSSEELRVYLNLAMECDVIELDEGEYLGPFDITQRRVTLRGQGEKTWIINKKKGTKLNRVSAIQITGDNCQVLCLKVICDSNEFTNGIELVGSGNQMEDVNFQGGAGCLHVEGSENHLSNLSFSNSENGLWLEGSDNKVVNIRIREMTGIGIGIHGDKNELELVNCDNVVTGVLVDGDSNKLRNIDLNNTSLIAVSTGVSILSGRGNVVNTLNSSSVLQLSNLTSESYVINSVCDGIMVDGSDNTLVNVDGKYVTIEGQDHRIINCNVGKCRNAGTNVILVECNFTYK